MRFAAIEGGGTTWVCAVAINDIDNFQEKITIPTTSPIETLQQVRQWLSTVGQIDAIGVASFGPIDANPSSETYGYITSTPKPGWRNTNVLQLIGAYEEFHGVPIMFDTDVNAPALAEFIHSVDTKRTSCAYITVGTGVGVGLVVNGMTVKGLLHPEAGHILMKPMSDDSFVGTCPFHGSCVEGMISNGALATRLGLERHELANVSDDNSVWDFCAFYIAQLCSNLILIASPERIILGGGIMKRRILYEKTRAYVLQILNSYVINPLLTSEFIGDYIVQSQWEDEAGLVGAAYLAKKALQISKER
jgi:fructokinase